MRDELVRQLLVLRPAVLVSVGLTLLAYLALLLCVRRLQIRGRGTRLAGLFVGLGGRSALHLSIAWAKFAFLIATLLLSQPAHEAHYLLLGGLTLAALLLRPGVGALITELAGGGLLLAGLAVCATLLNYLRQIRDAADIRAAYWLLAVFLILCAVAVLLREAVAISSERTYFDETGEIE